MGRTYQNISMDGNTFKTLRNPAPQVTEVPNTLWRKTAEGGKERATLFGNPARKRGYTIWLECGGSPDDQTTWDTFIATLSGYSATFTFVDHKGASFTARFLGFEENNDPEHESDILIAIEVIEAEP